MQVISFVVFCDFAVFCNVGVHNSFKEKKEYSSVYSSFGKFLTLLIFSLCVKR